MHTKKGKKLSYQKHRQDAQIILPTTSLCGVAAKWPTCSEDETDTLPKRPTGIQLYQFEPVRQDFERVLEHRVSFVANPMRYSMGFAKSHSLKCSLHNWV